MGHLSGLDGVLDLLIGLEVFVRQFEVVVPERDLAGPHLLDFLPRGDTALVAVAAFCLVVDQRFWFLQVRVALRGVGNHHLGAVGGVAEEVVHAFFFHEPRGEVEVAFAVLDAIVARFERALNLVGDLEALEHLFEDVGDRDVLEDAALDAFGQEPHVGD